MYSVQTLKWCQICNQERKKKKRTGVVGALGGDWGFLVSLLIGMSATIGRLLTGTCIFPGATAVGKKDDYFIISDDDCLVAVKQNGIYEQKCFAGKCRPVV